MTLDSVTPNRWLAQVTSGGYTVRFLAESLDDGRLVISWYDAPGNEPLDTGIRALDPRALPIVHLTGVDATYENAVQVVEEYGTWLAAAINATLAVRSAQAALDDTLTDMQDWHVAVESPTPS